MSFVEAKHCLHLSSHAEEKEKHILEKTHMQFCLRSSHLGTGRSKEPESDTCNNEKFIGSPKGNWKCASQLTLATTGEIQVGTPSVN